MTSSLDGVVQVHSWNSATGILGHLYSTKLAESITSIATDKTGDRFAFGTITGHVLFKMKGPSVTSKKRKAVPRAGTYSFFQRGMNTEAGTSSNDYTVASKNKKQKKLNKYNFVNIRMKLFGETSMRVANGEKDEPDVRHHKNATSPNLIHALDASMLHLTVLGFDAPIALIHDSVLCRATDMAQLSSVVRQVYMDIFAKGDPLQDFADAIGAETKPPKIGDLEPESVIYSTYFFC